MERAQELERCYDEAIALTEQLGLAIAAHSWTDLDPLLSARAELIARVQDLLAAGPVADPAPLAARLERLIALDAQHAAVLDARRAEVGHRLRTLASAGQALAGYAGEDENPEAVFLDADG